VKAAWLTCYLGETSDILRDYHLGDAIQVEPQPDNEQEADIERPLSQNNSRLYIPALDIVKEIESNATNLNNNLQAILPIDEDSRTTPESNNQPDFSSLDLELRIDIEQLETATITQILQECTSLACSCGYNRRVNGLTLREMALKLSAAMPTFIAGEKGP